MIPSATCLVITAALNTKATQTDNKVPDSTNVATKAALNIKSTALKVH